MNDPSAKTITWLGLFIFLFSLSCAHEYKPAVDASASPAQAYRYLASGDFQKSLETIQKAYAEHPGNAVLKGDYVKIIKQIKSYADIAFEGNQISGAGNAYGALLRAYVQYSDFADSLPFNKEFLSSRIKSCSNALYKNGLAKYREGKLDEAIAIWKRILAFDSENRGARDAISTAKVQLKNLQRIPKQ